jgi:membrane protein implicated in regulation of membrane protease activity
MLLGLVLLGLEVLTPGGFFVLFFGIAALVVGTMVGLGVGGPGWFQWLFFSALSIISLIFFRGPLLARLKPPEWRTNAIDTLVGEVAIPLEDLSPGAIGKVELRGTTWNARNGDRQSLRSGQRCRVKQVEGLTLWVEAE